MDIDKRNEFSGGDVNYYLAEVKEPKRLQPYTAECEDIIEVLQMTFAEGEAFKAIWRSCNKRAHGHGKRGQDVNGVYDGDKIAHYGDSIKRSRRRLKNASEVEAAAMHAMKQAEVAKVLHVGSMGGDIPSDYDTKSVRAPVMGGAFNLKLDRNM
jgi:hypothetical protein